MNRVLNFLSWLVTRRAGPDQTERALRWLNRLILVGIPVIALEAADFGGGSGFRFFAVGLLAAMGGLGAGAVLGLIFSLPANAQQVIVVGQKPTVPAVTAGASQPQPSSGYGDNNSLAQIGSWLAGAIIALSLAQFNALTDRFDHLANAVSVAMVNECRALLRTPVTAPVAAAVPQRRTGAAPPPVQAPPGLVLPACDSGVPGGLIIGTYMIFGFLLSYLWGRRYLAGEFALSRIDADNAAERASQLASLAASANLIPAGSSPAKAMQRTFSLETLPSQAIPNFPDVLQPGSVPNDPWKNVFGGRPVGSDAAMSAAVLPKPGDPDLFLIDLRVEGITPASKLVLRGRPLRLYLHPTYPDPIRLVRFDGEGMLRIALVAYGAFTVGAQLSSGTTLELDLAEIPDAPTKFRSR